MSNVNVRPNRILLDIREVDFSNTSKEYAKAEITTRVSVKKMKSELLQKIYEDFKDDTRMWVRHADIVKKEYKLREFDTMSPNGESKLLIYVEAWLNSMPEDELKEFYVDKVLEGSIPYYEDNTKIYYGSNI